jgi:hypothetical protein
MIVTVADLVKKRTVAMMVGMTKKKKVNNKTEHNPEREFSEDLLLDLANAEVSMRPYTHPKYETLRELVYSSLEELEDILGPQG